MQAEKSGLHRNDHFIAGPQSVESQQANARRAIDNAPFISVLNGSQGVFQAILAAMSAGEDLLESGQLDIGGGQIEIAGDLPDNVADFQRLAILRFDQRVEERLLDLLLGDGLTNAAMPLGIDIHQKRLFDPAGPDRRHFRLMLVVVLPQPPF